MTKDEAIHKALKVLNCLNNDRVYETAWVKGAINACEEALEQPTVAELNNEYLRDTNVIGLEQPAQEPVEFDMQSICDKYGIRLILDDEHTDINCGGSAGQNTIMLGKFDDKDLQITAFFHELGHCLFKPVNNIWMDTLSMEGTAWEVGRAEASKYAFNWDYHSKELTWARNQLKSYTHPHQWQKLTDDEYKQIVEVGFKLGYEACKCEQALKEKNHDS